MRTPVLFILTAATMAAAPVPGDARRGEEFLRSQPCLTCHAILGAGGREAPDLGRRASHGWSPTTMAALMWNHAPTMWGAMKRAGIERPVINEQQAADLFAYFYSLRYFEDPGDAARGRRVFVGRQCADCHAVSGAGSSGAPAVESWRALDGPVDLAAAMWNHAARMKQSMAARRVEWPRITAQEMTDLVVYFQSLPAHRNRQPAFAPAAAEGGADLFQSKGCFVCHTGRLSLEGRFFGRTLASFAAGMWNHAPKMLQLPPDVSGEEMRRLTGYLWSIQYFDTPGDPGRGARVFTSKHCVTCHGAGGDAPKLEGKALDSIAVVAALWKHGPAMLERMRQQNTPWPRFRNQELNDLIAYLRSRKP